MRDVLILAHGAFHGPWCWSLLMERLERRGVHCVAVDLNRGGLAPDRDALQAEVDAARAAGARVHAIGHSLGCASVQALDAETLASAMLLAGSAHPIGGMPSIEGSIAKGFFKSLEPQPDGRSALPREVARAAFYGRCDPAQAEWALDQLRPTFVYGTKPSDPIFWETTPVTYLGCEHDAVVSPDYQRAVCDAMRFSRMLDSDHSPMLCIPDALADAVEEAMRRADGDSGS